MEVKIPLFFPWIQFYWIGSIRCVAVSSIMQWASRRWSILFILGTRLFLKELRVYLKGKENTFNLFLKNKAEDLENPQKWAAAWYGLSIKDLRDAQPEFLNPDTLVEIMIAQVILPYQTLQTVRPRCGVSVFCFLDFIQRKNCLNSCE